MPYLDLISNVKVRLDILSTSTPVSPDKYYPYLQIADPKAFILEFSKVC